MKESLVYKLSIIFSVAGLMVSAYLYYIYTFELPLPCSNNGCEIVRYSKYSKMFSLPVPLYGIVFYLSVLATSISVLLFKGDVLKKFLLLSTVAGFAFSVYFTFLEIFVIKAICNWCVISAVFSSLLFGLYLYLWKKGFIKIR
jgi:uncharacterized membrane protein